MRLQLSRVRIFSSKEMTARLETDSFSAQVKRLMSKLIEGVSGCSIFAAMIMHVTTYNINCSLFTCK
jgi:hypothetical protein